MDNFAFAMIIIAPFTCMEPYHLYPDVLQGCTFTFIPNSMGSCHGQILIETETDSLGVHPFGALTVHCGTSLYKKPTYALKTPRVVALGFIYGVEYIIISDQERGKNNCPSGWITASCFICISHHLLFLNDEAFNRKTVLDLVTLTFDL